MRRRLPHSHGPLREGEAPAEPPGGVVGSAAAALSRPTRKHPAHGVLVSSRQPTLLLLTVCTKDRQRWLATPDAHELLCSVWMGATTWLVGRYVLMPDHLHLFCAPDEPPVFLERWVQYWKSQYSKRDRDPLHRWQANHWDTRSRRQESYAAKWDYVRNNPVRAELVARAEDWPYQGELQTLTW